MEQADLRPNQGDDLISGFHREEQLEFKVDKRAGFWLPFFEFLR